jgi:hypothetical protein
MVEEMCLSGGAVRVDMALLTAPLTGIELKSDRDTLARLPAQMKVYNQVFGRMILIIGPKHLTKALALVPDWWGIFVATMAEDEAVSLEIVRPAGDNPKLSAKAVATLLWRAETLDLLKEHGLDKGFRTKNLRVLRKRLNEGVAGDEIVAAVSRTLSKRPGTWLPTK